MYFFFNCVSKCSDNYSEIGEKKVGNFLVNTDKFNFQQRLTLTSKFQISRILLPILFLVHISSVVCFRGRGGWRIFWKCESESICNYTYLIFRYGTTHHNRSQSVRTPGSKSNVQVGINGTSRYRPNYLCLPQQRTRVASMPNTGVEEEYYRLRQFSISGKSIINRGDSLKSRRSRSNTSVASSNSSHRWVDGINISGRKWSCKHTARRILTA